VKVTIYVEGGGDSKYQHIQCRQGFRKLIEKAGFVGKMPGIVASGGGNATFDDFNTAMKSRSQTVYPMLLVDSEEPVAGNITPWNHLRTRDGWTPPYGVSDDQAQLMVTCMETWLMADRAALREVFGACLQDSALLPEANLEQYARHQVQQALEHVTRNCGEKKADKKGRRLFQVLETVNPNTLKQRLPYFRRFIETLEKLLHS
jgi:hypothetical protein